MTSPIGSPSTRMALLTPFTPDKGCSFGINVGWTHTDNGREILFCLLSQLTAYASFPVSESIISTTTEIVNNNPDDNPLSKKGKIVWFVLGLFLGIFGVIIAIITQIIRKEKGIIKFALLGFAGFLLITYLISGELPYELGEIENIFILG